MMARFSLGQVVATHTIAADLEGAEIMSMILRHANGDWGELDTEDQEANNEALEIGERLLSKYTASNGQGIYVITEWDRSATTVLYCDEY